MPSDHDEGLPGDEERKKDERVERGRREARTWLNGLLLG